MGGLENILGRAAGTTCRASQGRSGRGKPVSLTLNFLSLPLCHLDKERGMSTPWPEFIFHSGVLSPIAPLSALKGLGVQ